MTASAVSEFFLRDGAVMRNRTKFAIVMSIYLSLVIGIISICQIRYVKALSGDKGKAIETWNQLSSGDGILYEALIPVIKKKTNVEVVKVPPAPHAPRVQQQKNKKDNTQKPIEGRVAYLTFDDGPSTNTLKVLKILRENNVKATFFVTGNNNTGDNSIYKKILSEGHALGNHTFSHNYGRVYSTADGFFEDLKRLENLLQSTTGICPNIVRMPGGSNNTVSNKYGGKKVINEIISRLREQGYQYFDWNVSSTDGGVSSREVIINSVLRGARNKKTAIILFHDSSSKGTTVEALPIIIPQLKKMGFRFEVVTKDTYAYQFKK